MKNLYSLSLFRQVSNNITKATPFIIINLISVELLRKATENN